MKGPPNFENLKSLPAQFLQMQWQAWLILVLKSIYLMILTF